MQAIQAGVLVPSPAPTPESPSAAVQRFRAIVERFSSGAEIAKAALDSYCPDPFKAILKPLVDVLAFLAKNYLQLVANREAAAKMGLTCASAAHSIRDLLLGDPESIASATRHPAVKLCAELIVEAHGYIVRTLSPPKSQQKKWMAKMKAAATVNSVKTKLETYDRELKEQITQVSLAVSVSMHTMLVVIKSQNEAYVAERVAMLAAASKSMQTIAEAGDDTTTGSKVDKIANIAVTANVTQMQLRADVALNNVVLDDDQLAKIESAVSRAKLDAQSAVQKLDGMLNIAEWMINVESVAFRDSDDTLLGQGASGKVLLGKMDGKNVAVKLFDMRRTTSLTVERNIAKEIEAWRQVSDHPNVVSLLGVCTKVRYFIVSEYCENRNAREYLQKLSSQGQEARWSSALVNILAESVDGLSYLHSKGLIHRDVKGANIFVRKDGSAAIGDFGLSRAVGKISTMSNMSMKGTLNWCSPEQLTKGARNLTAKTDTWSFGMTVYELLTDNDPYDDYFDALQVRADITANNPQLPTPPHDVPDNLTFLVNLVAECCKKEPTERISDSDIADRFADAISFRSLLRAAERGDAAMQFVVALHYLFGVDTLRDEAVARTMLEKAANLNFEHAALLLALLHAAGIGGATDEAAAESWSLKLTVTDENFRREAECLQSVDSYTEALDARFSKWLVVLRTKGAITSPSRAYSAYLLSRLSIAAGNTELSFGWAKRAGEGGLTAAMIELAMMYRDGYGVPPSVPEWVFWLRKVAEKGHAPSQAIIGRYCLHGQCGVEKNEREAASWAVKSARQGDKYGQLLLGQIMTDGRGLRKDELGAASLFLQSARQGHPDAQFMLGTLHRDGRGVPRQSFSEAVAWFRKAAEQGHSKAQCCLGDMYSRGRGVPHSFEEAAAWYKKAADGGDVRAKKILDGEEDWPLVRRTPPALCHAAATISQTQHSQEVRILAAVVAVADTTADIDIATMMTPPMPSPPSRRRHRQWDSSRRSTAAHVLFLVAATVAACCSCLLHLPTVALAQGINGPPTGYLTLTTTATTVPSSTTTATSTVTASVSSTSSSAAATTSSSTTSATTTSTSSTSTSTSAAATSAAATTTSTSTSKTSTAVTTAATTSTTAKTSTTTTSAAATTTSAAATTTTKATTATATSTTSLKTSTSVAAATTTTSASKAFTSLVTITVATATTSVPVRYKCSAGSVAVRVSSSTTTSAAAATTTTSAAKASSTTTSTAAAGTTTAATAATTSKTTTTAAAASTASNVVPSYNPSADQLLQSLLTAIAGLANKPDIATVLAAAAALDPALNATQLLAQITAAGSRTVTQATFTALLTSLGVSDASITAAGGITGVLTSLIGDLSKTTVAAAVIAVQGTLTGLGATLTSIADVATKVLGALLSG